MTPCRGDGKGNSGVCDCGQPRAWHIDPSLVRFDLNGGTLAPRFLEQILIALNAHGQVTIVNGAIGQQMSLMELGAYLAQCAVLDGKQL